MFAIRNPVTTAGATNLESQLSMAVSLANKALDNVNRLVDLNMNLARATLEHSNFLARQLMSAEDKRELFSVMSAQTRPNTRRTFDYAYYLTTILTRAQLDFMTILVQGAADSSRKVVSLAGGAGTAPLSDGSRKIQVTADTRPETTIEIMVSERTESNGGGSAAKH